jgi:hypothetical protein
MTRTIQDKNGEAVDALTEALRVVPRKAQP